MKMTNEMKIKTLESVFAIEQLCEEIKNEILSGNCFDSGEFTQIKYLWTEVDKLKKINK